MTSVLDASAVLAFLRREKGAPFVEKRLVGAILSTVNYSEVLKKAVEHGGLLSDARSRVELLQLTILPLDACQAEIAAGLWPAVRHLGLSMADRCCLALAVNLNRPVLTADQNWAKLDIGVKTELIR